MSMFLVGNCLEALAVQAHPAKYSQLQQHSSGMTFFLCYAGCSLTSCHLLLQIMDKHTLAAKRILSPCSGVVVPGELCALVGPSGAGAPRL